jgi:hypothetical protein
MADTATMRSSPKLLNTGNRERRLNRKNDQTRDSSTNTGDFVVQDGVDFNYKSDLQFEYCDLTQDWLELADPAKYRWMNPQVTLCKMGDQDCSFHVIRHWLLQYSTLFSEPNFVGW